MLINDVQARCNRSLEMVKTAAWTKESLKQFENKGTNVVDITDNHWLLAGKIIYLLEPADSSRNQTCFTNLNSLCVFSREDPLTMILQGAAEIGMRVIKAEMQVKNQGRFCYLESQLCCYTAIFLEPRSIFCKQYK